MTKKVRASRNRTITLQEKDRISLSSRVMSQIPATRSSTSIEGIAFGNYKDWIKVLPLAHVDLLFLDPPYNLDKNFNGTKFSKRDIDEYTQWLDSLMSSLKPLLKPTATVYICGDWFSSVSIFEAASNHFMIHNRITWEREKGRGARHNWKNSSEDIWFCTVSDKYSFNVDRVKVRRKVIAPYTDMNGKPKDWVRSKDGNFRDTHPSNLWTDITIPFWSMPENTDHPTQKSEKMLAKLILASTNHNDFILDPFLGSGTTLAVAKKLQRRALGIEINEAYCLLAARRLEMAETDAEIQGYADGVFWERNTVALRKSTPTVAKSENLEMFSEMTDE